ncbi:putative metal-dependent hydrolase [Paenibacillus baekrokdamisoli]|uniref:Putative metal-dependent hydrolase Back11_00800 n=1 Tax=Paenibacillus baekrokdamisoli TaxID=1712516 RepID=A0A3G9IRZ5_9BACL|nr:bacillithiol transferase BstA [Paenibacillus baekrokdamisoli]MBB3069292.1 putative damage-inducible protein DinB [Paenibacillus baekrokdamisoli]BBH18735.1 putative metal-dependent hydrolase [Paenibacillus baekrokdamisoli]
MDARYPIGHFESNGAITSAQRAAWIEELEQLPSQLAAAVNDLSQEQLNTPYREEGWTVRQVIHHIADSHMNSYTRFKLALTEDRPTIRPYYEDRWAELADTTTAPIALSLVLIKALHERWVILLKTMSEADYARTFFHPESEKTIALDYNLGVYAWHGKHHLAHITKLAERMGW